jgi:hypothetical protein
MRLLPVVTLLTLIASVSLGAPTPLMPGSRIQALSGAFVGLADDANAIFYNPAGIAYLNMLATDISFWRTDDGQFGGVSAMFINPSSAAGSMVGLGWTGIGVTSGTSEERAGAFVLPSVFYPAKGIPLGAGIKVTYDRDLLGNLKWRGTADVATLVPIIETFRLGAIAKNIIKTDQDQFPSSFRIGCAWLPSGTIRAMLDVEGETMDQVRDGDVILAVGAEVQPIHYVSFQGGMLTRSDDTMFSLGADMRQAAGGSSLGIAYWCPSDDIGAGWFSVGFVYKLR